MDRTFHHRITIGAVCGIILMLVLAVYAFWIKDIILGVICALVLVIIAERTLHSEYIFHGKELIIYKGRLSSSKHIPLAAIQSCVPMTSVFGLVRYLLISYGNGHTMIASVQPQNEAEFIAYLRKRKMRESENEE